MTSTKTRELFLQWLPWIRYRASKYVPVTYSEVAKEDFIADIVAHVWEKSALYDPAQSKFSTWSYYVVQNKAFSILRQAARRRRHPREDLATRPPQFLLDPKIDYGRFRDRLSTLHRYMLDSIMSGVSKADLGRQLGLSRRTVKRYLVKILDEAHRRED